MPIMTAPGEDLQPRRRETTAIDGRVPADLLASIAEEIRGEGDQRPEDKATEEPDVS
ncbi:hypothetical protein [Frankia sp. Cr1]|uniref:hypothetical protein n=1 Tax=Frankia sp. Cr1 TaxID=3073931 RepID=UPI002AD33F37|nr:hypothetical protein [Frankia sp. Cr1]